MARHGVSSLLDTDLYKLTMQCLVLRFYPTTHVTYALTNRTPHMRLNREAFAWLQGEIAGLSNLHLEEGELRFLRSVCAYLPEPYLRYLQAFRFQPSAHLTVEFRPTANDARSGDLHLGIGGLWVDTILYEIPLLALVSEAYFKFCDVGWNHAGQEAAAFQKGASLLRHGCLFSEFGTRRRRDYETQDVVIAALKKAHDEHPGSPGALTGTSNVHFAMKYGLSPVGTVAHEWFMGIAAASNDYRNANETALKCWLELFGAGVLGIALTDTFGTPAFLDAFAKEAPLSAPAQDGRTEKATYGDIFAGVRQDSGDPKEFIKIMRDFYNARGNKDPKIMVFSDSLNVDRCLEYKAAAEALAFKPTFGVGTFFTNDFTDPSTGRKSVPLNIVIKLSSANGNPAVKLSDDTGKNTGDSKTVRAVKEQLGYEDRVWPGGNEEARWGGESTAGPACAPSERSVV